MVQNHDNIKNTRAYQHLVSAFVVGAAIAVNSPKHAAKWCPGLMRPLYYLCGSYSPSATCLTLNYILQQYNGILIFLRVGRIPTPSCNFLLKFRGCCQDISYSTHTRKPRPFTRRSSSHIKQAAQSWNNQCVTSDLSSYFSYFGYQRLYWWSTVDERKEQIIVSIIVMRVIKEKTNLQAGQTYITGKSSAGHTKGPSLATDPAQTAPPVNKRRTFCIATWLGSWFGVLED